MPQQTMICNHLFLVKHGRDIDLNLIFFYKNYTILSFSKQNVANWWQIYIFCLYVYINRIKWVHDQLRLLGVKKWNANNISCELFLKWKLLVFNGTFSEISHQNEANSLCLQTTTKKNVKIFSLRRCKHGMLTDVKFVNFFFSIFSMLYKSVDVFSKNCRHQMKNAWSFFPWICILVCE